MNQTIVNELKAAGAETLASKIAVLREDDSIAATYLLDEVNEALEFHRSLGRRADLIGMYDSLSKMLSRIAASGKIAR